MGRWLDLEFVFNTAPLSQHEGATPVYKSNFHVNTACVLDPKICTRNRVHTRAHTQLRTHQEELLRADLIDFAAVVEMAQGQVDGLDGTRQLDRGAP